MSSEAPDRAAGRSGARRAAGPPATVIALLAVGAFAILIGGCDTGACARHSDCDQGLVCSPAGACVVPPVDAAAGDGGADALGGDAAEAPSDAGPIDASAIDASSIDASSIDASSLADAAPDAVAEDAL